MLLKGHLKQRVVNVSINLKEIEVFHHFLLVPSRLHPELAMEFHLSVKCTSFEVKYKFVVKGGLHLGCVLHKHDMYVSEVARFYSKYSVYSA